MHSRLRPTPCTSTTKCCPRISRNKLVTPRSLEVATSNRYQTMGSFFLAGLPRRRFWSSCRLTGRASSKILYGVAPVCHSQPERSIRIGNPEKKDFLLLSGSPMSSRSALGSGMTGEGVALTRIGDCGRITCSGSR